ncbi:MAG: DUF2244 domain-containing protein [Paracoccus sp. (in: a-proteobacteria)]|nr:DUF2244 domain-containing protein [Paracoccus sp. (in: a-proteobacteria)]
MPYQWYDGDGESTLQAWPHRSLPRRGFVWFIAITALLASAPLVAVLGRAVLWGLLPFMLAMVAGLWWAIERSYRSGHSHEVLRLTPEGLTLTRHDPGRPDRCWQANPYWVRPALRKGPVDDYLTLTDGQRELELGAFLTPEERRSLHQQITQRLADLRSHRGR